MRPVLVIGGPTAAGKTRLALRIACVWGAALVSADAVQVYRGMDIGTAKPPPSVLRRFPHGALDVRDPDEDFSVSDFLDAVHAARAASDRVVVVGGTPFYLSALVRPLAPMPASDPTVRARLEALPDPHARLAEVDPAAAARLHPNDRVRVIRALEVHALTGRPLSEVHEAGRATAPPFPVEVVWLDPGVELVSARIEARLDDMLARGYLDEVRRLLDRGYGPELKPMRSLGYKHLAEHLSGQLDLDEAVQRTLRDTRRLARKQRTWARGLGWAPATTEDALDAARRAFGDPPPRR